MAEPRIERKLAAILAADVVGYSRLVGADEPGTIARLKALRKEFIEPLIAEYRGRVVKLIGDGALVEFASAVDAVECAVAIQNGVAEREAVQPEDRRIQFRIGINVGDIIVEDGDILGDGVNVAARLEGLAEPGGICIAQPVHKQIKSKLGILLEPMGEHRVKNIAEPVEVWRVALDEAAPRMRKRRRLAPVALAASIAALLALGAGAWWWQHSRAAVQATATDPVQALPSRPTIAVLPFDNMSADPEQAYFADGITDDIISRMTQFKELGVIARNSTFQYKGRAVDIREAGKALGARYVLEGSVRRGGDAIRITTQLIDASDGTHLWAESFERPLTAVGIFDIQDQITAQVAGIVADRYGIVMRTLMRDVKHGSSVRLGSYECVLKAADYIFDPSYEEYQVARDCLDRVTTEEPQYADAWAARSEIYSDGVTVWADPKVTLDQSVEFANRAIQIDAEHPHAHWALSYAYFAKEDFEQFRTEAERAIELDPNNSAVVGQLATYIAALGEWDRGIALLKQSIKLNPNYQPWLNYAFVAHHIRRGEYEVALRYARDYVARAPDFVLAHMNMIWTLGLMGRGDEAKPHIDRVLELVPDFNTRVHSLIAPWYFDDELIARLYEGLRSAGMEISEVAESHPRQTDQSG